MDITGLGQAFSSQAPMATAIALSVFCGSTLAQSSDSPGVPSTTADEVEYSTTDTVMQRQLRPFGTGSNGAPRYTRSDVEVAPWRSLAGMQAAGGYRAEVSEISARWWFSSGRTDVGLGVGSVALMAQPMSGAMAADTAAVGIALASSPSLSVGLRRRTSATSTVYADATRSHSAGLSGIDSYSGKVGVEWKRAESRWSVAYSGLGLRLSSESRMTVNLRKGGLGIYMRSQF